MPKYKNLNSSPVVVNSVKFDFLEEKEVYFYTNNENLKMTDPNPIWSPVAYSEQVSSGSVKITDNLVPSVNVIRIASKTDSSLVSFNESGSSKVLVTSGSPLMIRPVGRINEIFVHEGNVSIELWNEFNWRG